MADVKFERTKSLSRREAATWLSALARGLEEGDEVELPVGAGGVVTLRLPEGLRAEFEVEVSGDEVEVEVELAWSLAPPAP